MEDKLLNLKLDLIFDFLNQLPDNQIVEINPEKPNIFVITKFYDGLVAYFHFFKDINKLNFESECLSFELIKSGITIIDGYRLPELVAFEINQHYGKETKKETRYEG